MSRTNSSIVPLELVLCSEPRDWSERAPGDGGGNGGSYSSCSSTSSPAPSAGHDAATGRADVTRGGHESHFADRHVACLYKTDRRGPHFLVWWSDLK